jgi:CRISPR-associated endonuclease/helicase Cas3
VAKAEALPGLFTLTVPTGGGKTLASLSFALEHAARHGLRRVIHVAPFTAIIEQTASVFRSALASEDDVLEHHANVDWPETDTDDESGGERRKLRRATENWEVPVVVTTAVQFFESLFAARTARCRKLHNLARSVIVLDEAQAMPLHLLRPCMAAIEELALNYGASVVLCTATQPALRVKDGFVGGFNIGEDREIAPEPRALYAALKRVRVEVLPDPQPDAEVVQRFGKRDQMLCIVNSRAHARTLFEAIRHLPGAIHLSTLMVPNHRREVLAELRRRVAAGEAARVVSTSLIEAGVDLDMPEVWRAVAGLDSIAQAAGRCNRNGLLPMGRVVVFEPAEAKPPQALQAFWQATRPVLRTHEDLLSLDAVGAYFRELYWQKGSEALDAAEVDGVVGVLRALKGGGREGRFPFRSTALHRATTSKPP